jgi:ATP-dependent helicase/nuclease subunit A
MRLADRLTGYGAVIANLPQGSRRLADMNGMLDLLGKLARLGRGNVFSAHRHIRELYESEIEIPRPLLESGDAVSLMTIHKAKGLEWPVVFIPDLASNHSGDRQPIVVDSELGVAFQMDGEDYETTEPAILKLIKAKQKARDREEAKRLLYVAITRAKDKVYLTASKGKGFDLDILSPGLDAAGVAVEVIPFVEHLANVPTPGKQAPFELPEHINTSPLTAGSNRIPVSALTIYAKCPRQFAYLYVDGHPGIGEGAAAARTIGTLTHLALELGVSNIETLRRESYVNDDDQLKDAIALAQRFTDDPAYTAMRGIECQKEVKFRFDMNGLILEGIADLVGEDFVLDYKTDAEIHPTEHVFQLWAYAKALKKQRAYIAYLKHDFLHEFTADDLAAAEADAIKMINSIRSGICEPTPSRSVCTVCQYRSVCEHMVVE